MRFLFDCHEGGGDFAGGVGVTSAIGGGDTVFIEGSGGFEVAFLFAGAAGHKVAGDVVGSVLEELVEFVKGVVVAVELGVFHGDGVAEEGVCGFGGEEGEELVEAWHGGLRGVGSSIEDVDRYVVVVKSSSRQVVVSFECEWTWGLFGEGGEGEGEPYEEAGGEFDEDADAAAQRCADGGLGGVGEGAVF